MSRIAPQDQRESGRIRMIREAMEKVLSCLVWGERVRMGHPVQTGAEDGTPEWGKREGGVVIEKELLAWGLCNSEGVLGSRAVASWSSRYGLSPESLLSSGERNGNWGFVAEVVGNATCRCDLPALTFLIFAKAAAALLRADGETWGCG